MGEEKPTHVAHEVCHSCSVHIETILGMMNKFVVHQNENLRKIIALQGDVANLAKRLAKLEPQQGWEK